MRGRQIPTLFCTPVSSHHARWQDFPWLNQKVSTVSGASIGEGTVAYHVSINKTSAALRRPSRHGLCNSVWGSVSGAASSRGQSMSIRSCCAGTTASWACRRNEMPRLSSPVLAQALGPLGGPVCEDSGGSHPELCCEAPVQNTQTLTFAGRAKH